MDLTSHPSPLLDETYHAAILPCGLTAFVFPKPGMQRKIAVYGARYGSIDNDFTAAGHPFSMPEGIAHFLEHQMFKKEKGDLLVEFSRKGASSNAMTEYSSTCYYFSCIDNFADNLATLTDLAFDACFRDEWVEKEKLIIEQELRMYRDMPDFRIYQNLQESLYRRHPARVDIGGTVESIRRITRNQLEQCWRTFYAPSNMVLAVSGDVEAAELLESVQARIAAKGLAPDGRIRRAYPREPRSLGAARRAEKMQVGRPKFLMAFKETDPPRNGADLVLREVEINLVLDCLLGRGSALYDRLYRKGLIDDSFSATYSTTPTFGATALGGETDDPAALEAELAAGISKFLRDGVRGRELDRIKRKYLGHFLRGFDSVDQCAFTLLRFWFKRFDVFDLPKLVRHVTPSALAKAARGHFREEARAVSLIEPRDGVGAEAVKA
ncbi:MAG: insulinase family protein [Planctomycetes bacterium]|nr:insulinase family protein [Planctomycetota bacterium]